MSQLRQTIGIQQKNIFNKHIFCFNKTIILMPLKFKPKLSRYFRFKICFFPLVGEMILIFKRNKNFVQSSIHTWKMSRMPIVRLIPISLWTDASENERTTGDADWRWHHQSNWGLPARSFAPIEKKTKTFSLFYFILNIFLKVWIENVSLNAN